MQQEAFLVGAFQGVDELLVVAGAQGGDHQGLGLAAGEQGRAVGARQDADFRDDRADHVEGASVDALTGVSTSRRRTEASHSLKAEPNLVASTPSGLASDLTRAATALDLATDRAAWRACLAVSL